MFGGRSVTSLYFNNNLDNKFMYFGCKGVSANPDQISAHNHKMETQPPQLASKNQAERLKLLIWASQNMTQLQVMVNTWYLESQLLLTVL